MGQKAIIAVDVDEVLAYFMPALAKYHNETYGGVQLTSDSFTSYEFHNVWGGTKEETLSKVQL